MPGKCGEENGSSKQNNAKPFPKPAAEMVGKLPGICVFHRLFCAVTKDVVNTFGRVVFKIEAKTKHGERNQ